MGLWAVPRFGILWEKWLDHTVDMCVFRLCIPMMFSKVVVVFYTPSNCDAISCSSTPGSTLGVVHLFNFNHSNECIVISHCGFNSCVPNTKDLSIFHAFIYYPYIFFGEVSKSGPFLLGCLFSH